MSRVVGRGFSVLNLGQISDKVGNGHFIFDRARQRNVTQFGCQQNESSSILRNAIVHTAQNSMIVTIAQLIQR